MTQPFKNNQLNKFMFAIGVEETYCCQDSTFTRHIFETEFTEEMRKQLTSLQGDEDEEYVYESKIFLDFLNKYPNKADYNIDEVTYKLCDYHFYHIIC
jgi:hypothetical protein